MDIPKVIWTKDRNEALKIQRNFAKKLNLNFENKKIDTVGGIDLSFPQKGIALAILTILSFKDLRMKKLIYHIYKVEFPYISGLLSFREGPIIIDLLKKVNEKIDLFFIDGQGIAHPRSFGLASHIGTLIKKPTIGIAKSHLYGKFNKPLNIKNDFKELTSSNKIIGYVLRSKENCNPIFISPGNYIDSETSLKIVKRSITKYKLPEPTRLAHKYSQIYKKKLFISKINN